MFATEKQNRESRDAIEHTPVVAIRYMESQPLCGLTGCVRYSPFGDIARRLNDDGFRTRSRSSSAAITASLPVYEFKFVPPGHQTVLRTLPSPA